MKLGTDVVKTIINIHKPSSSHHFEVVCLPSPVPSHGTIVLPWPQMRKIWAGTQSARCFLWKTIVALGRCQACKDDMNTCHGWKFRGAKLPNIANICVCIVYVLFMDVYGVWLDWKVWLIVIKTVPKWKSVQRFSCVPVAETLGSSQEYGILQLPGRRISAENAAFFWWPRVMDISQGLFPGWWVWFLQMSTSPSHIPHLVMGPNWGYT